MPRVTERLKWLNALWPNTSNGWTPNEHLFFYVEDARNIARDARNLVQDARNLAQDARNLTQDAYTTVYVA